jgi:glycosyltransferase involved in cell wall biosynthesis
MRIKKDSVDILLSTYNGEKYLKEFSRSLELQTFKSWNLIIRDDGSVDQSVKYLCDFKDACVNSVYVTEGKVNLGIIASINKMINSSRAPYVMFADQDDVWFPKKIELSLEKIKAIEQEVGGHVPIVIFSDKTVVDEALKRISPSFFSYMKLMPEWSQQLKNLLVQNVASGCTMIMNRALVERAFPIPSDAIMHDWWVMLVASTFGEIGYLNEATMLYRQHPNNSIGARPLGVWSGLKLIVRRPDFFFDKIKSTQLQAIELLKRYDLQLELHDRELIKSYAYLSSQNVFTKWWLIMKYRFRKSTLRKSLVFYLYV